MTNGSGERLDRIERILERLARSQEQFQEQSAKSQVQFQERMAKNLEQFEEHVAKTQREMAARQQYHDEAFERHDAEMKVILEAIAADGENIRALARIAERHQQRLDGLEGGEST